MISNILYLDLRRDMRGRHSYPESIICHSDAMLSLSSLSGSAHANEPESARIEAADDGASASCGETTSLIIWLLYLLR